MTEHRPHNPERISDRWIGWVKDPLIERAGITFDRTPADNITAPEGRFRVCAYHIDFDERPTSYQDVDTRADAQFICENFSDCRGSWNVDYVVTYDDAGEIVISNRPY